MKLQTRKTRQKAVSAPPSTEAERLAELSEFQRRMDHLAIGLHSLKEDVADLFARAPKAQ